MGKQSTETSQLFEGLDETTPRYSTQGLVYNPVGNRLKFDQSLTVGRVFVILTLRQMFEGLFVASGSNLMSQWI